MSAEIILRQVTMDDVALLLAWRNDPLTRNQSLSSEEIPQNMHRNWLQRSLDNENQQLYMAVKQTLPVGTVRAEYKNSSYQLSWTIAPAARGQGFGKIMVAVLVEQLSGEINAVIKQDNLASIRIAQYCNLALQRQENDILFFTRSAFENNEH